MSQDASSVPLIDIGPLVRGAANRVDVGRAIDRACRENGFFYVVNHGVDPALEARLERLSREFFARDEAWKSRIAMSRGGRAWRGYFPVGGELTSGKPDRREGIYFGAELGPEHPAVKAGLPLHGANLFPDDMPQMREVVLAYMSAMTQLGHLLMEGMALGLGLPESYFADRFTGDPLVLFRIFHYPAAPPEDDSWGVGEHTDYGVLTILKQDDRGGLEVKCRRPDGSREWVAAPPLPGTFVCNIGDMLDRMTGGRYRSTPHRVRNTSGLSRVSFPFFFDPSFHAEVRPIPLADAAPVRDDHDERWDKASVHAFQGTYGDYLLAKVSKVFPELGSRVLRS